MGREGHRRGEESDALAAIARALRAGAPLAPEKAAAAAAPAATPPAAQPDSKHVNNRKDKKPNKEASEKKKKRKHEAAATAAAASGEDEPGVSMQPPRLTNSEDDIELALQGLRQATAALQEAAQQAAGSPPTLASLHQCIQALAACAEQLCDALAAAGAAQPPAALQQLRSQAQLLLDSCQPRSSGVPALRPSVSQLAALQLQAAAAAAAMDQRQAQRVAPPAEDPGQRLRFQQHYLAAFADSFAAEVEALQEAEPPIPAGVLLQCVRMAADSEALHPPRLPAVVLDAAAAAAAAAAGQP
ncbi:hypothetical protein C2E21_2403 isoform B [Chlorella sorokiniana]|uniref:Uncharacterized protein n=1 Tax=Chlorella sorokiniana TaxID=3076 RepID=A0A2P6TXG5_CHLSO|nr:hypothetical protein C2E21_2403 isoform A [Chlorella sorokiniana]PRW58760.1 hypothetical protein C2E21_2403 isoform B [Chlorella sorokiniana]|eukprot:PRW58759.1 hypothetical protein C2E21_2403 isoform A [Chlorella sorokiniana]